MPVYNKLKIAILAIITTPTVHALTLDPIEVQSGAGNLLYAEMKFRNADPHSRIEAGLAESQDLIQLGIGHQPPGHLNFFTRKSGNGSGVIVITSSRPMIESELNILIKIKEGSATHIQQIKTRLNRPVATPSKAQTPPQLTHRETSLIPQNIVSEKDIALNLPMSTQYTVKPTQTAPVATAMVTQTSPVAASGSSTPTTSTVASSSQALEVPLAINVSPLPALNTNIHPTRITATAQPLAIDTQTQAQTAPTFEPKLAAQNQPSIGLVQPLTSTLTIRENIRAATPTPPPVTAQPPLQQPNTVETSSAQLKTAQKTPEQSTPERAQKESGKSAPAPAPAPAQTAQSAHVVQANESLWKIASEIAAKNNQPIPDVMRQIKANNQHAFIGGNINRIRQGAALNLSAQSIPRTQKKTTVRALDTRLNQPQSGKEKYKLNQAEMTLVTESKQDFSQGSSKEKTIKNQLPSELSTKIMTAREKTVKLQKNVSHLTLAIQQKDQRIQLLNARLAQLQQQLQQKNQTKKPAN